MLDENPFHDLHREPKKYDSEKEQLEADGIRRRCWLAIFVWLLSLFLSNLKVISEELVYIAGYYLFYAFIRLILGPLDNLRLWIVRGIFLIGAVVCILYIWPMEPTIEPVTCVEELLKNHSEKNGFLICKIFERVYFCIV